MFVNIITKVMTLEKRCNMDHSVVGYSPPLLFLPLFYYILLMQQRWRIIPDLHLRHRQPGDPISKREREIEIGSIASKSVDDWEQ